MCGVSVSNHARNLRLSSSREAPLKRWVLDEDSVKLFSDLGSVRLGDCLPRLMVDETL
jgi:hypothetical protein